MGEAGFLEHGSINFDVGGGRFNRASEFLSEVYGVKNFVYDPYNRPYYWNEAILSFLKNHHADTATLFNVLNVIPDKEERIDAIQLALSRTKTGLFITVYEKNKDGKLEYTRDGWQMNQPLSFYEEEIRKAFESVSVECVEGLLVLKNTPSM